MILDYVLKFHVPECLDILNGSDILGHYSLKIDFMKLFETHPDIGDKVLCSPVETLSLCDKDIIKAQQRLLEDEDYKIQVAKLDYCSIKNYVHARFFGLPVCPELHRMILPKNVDLGCFLKVTGTIVRVTQTKMLEYHRKYVCNKCKHETQVEADFEQRYVLKAPLKCANKEKKCKCTNFTQVNLVSREHCKDYQEIKIQEQVNKLSIGTIPGSMWVVLEDDLVDSCKPGDDVNICGTVRRRWRPSIQSKKCEVELVLQANWIQVCNAQRSEVIAMAPDVRDCFDEYWTKFEACPVKGRDGILAAVSPQVYGLHLVKLALLLTVITSSNHIVDGNDKKMTDEDREPTSVRGQCHLLLVGDPGTGKSQLLRAAAELTPRSVFTSGSGSTKAGLTCSALREDGEWQLEAGALVLSDGGVCCIDEIGQLREHDRGSIHEAMEQQTISIAKAGIVCKLNTRCAVVAACNPKGHYDSEQPLSCNVSLGTPLLSRFDLIFILLDTKNKAWDNLVSSYILFGGFNNALKSQWPIEKLQMYIALVGPRSTEMTRSANIILQTYYMAQRKSELRDPSRTTVRMLDSLVRLSQAHCRLMYRTTIQPMDAIVAVSLVDLSMQDCTLKDTTDALHSTFPKHPDFTYLCTAKKLLTQLSLYEIWKEELLSYAKILKTDHKTLENEIDNLNSQIFAKYDNVSDDNIPLSATLITSSYFSDGKKKKSKMDKEKKDKGIVNEKLEATLKKYSSMNKEAKNPQSSLQKTKRKRNEVVLDTEGFVKPKKSRKKKGTDDEVDVTSILKAVPSVNDVFGDLDIDLNFTSSNCEENHDKDIKKDEDETVSEVKKEPEDISQKENVNNNLNKKVARNLTTLSKLKQFECKKKQHDLSKLLDSERTKRIEIKVEHNTNTPQGSQISIFESSICDISFDEKLNNDKSSPQKSVTNPNLNKTSSDSSIEVNNKKSVTSSQISIFESSDCDIDLDL